MCNGGCGKKVYSVHSSNRVVRNASPKIEVPEEPCEYTMDILNNYSIKIKCFRSKGLYLTNNVSFKTVNIALGTVLSALHYPTNPCYLKDRIEKYVVPLIVIITNTGQC